MSDEQREFSVEFMDPIYATVSEREASGDLTMPGHVYAVLDALPYHAEQIVAEVERLRDERVPDAESWDAGYAQGYSAGYSWAVQEVIRWLIDNGHADAGEALRYFMSPEGVREMNERLCEVYGSLAKLAVSARDADPAGKRRS